MSEKGCSAERESAKGQDRSKFYPIKPLIFRQPGMKLRYIISPPVIAGQSIKILPKTLHTSQRGAEK